jgi:uncharacterized repeat protein (TIGR03803 family)
MAFAYALAPIGSASAYTLNTMHSFCAEASNCGDGDTPLAGLVEDSAGNFYGVTEKGGKYNSGLVFKLVPNGQNTYKEFILHNFCARTNCTDGGFPENAELILDTDGNLYGTTGSGGAHDAGVVFKLTHETNGWSLNVLHSFCASMKCTDGSFPNVGLAYAGQASGAPWDKSSPLFGTTDFGGAHNIGTVYELVPGGSGWTHTILHNFNHEGTNTDPGPLLVDPSGNLIGMTYFGGKYGGGLIYRLAAGTWTDTVLHNFCADPSCTDGSGGAGRPLMDAAGNLFGTTSNGGTGAHCTRSGGCGVAFKRPPGGPYKVIYNFCSLKKCKDGEFPSAGLIMNNGGDLFGTTYGGGTGTGGAVFSLTHSGGWNETVLYDFCSLQNCGDGGGPVAPLIQGKKGRLYSTTSAGGAHGDYGTAFELDP